MHNVERILKLGDILLACRIEILQGKLHNWWRINDSTVPLPKAAGSCSHWLLTDSEEAALDPGKTVNSFAISTGIGLVSHLRRLMLKAWWRRQA